MGKQTHTKTKQKKNKKYMLVRYGRMNELGWFEHNENQVPKIPRRVVVKTNKGLELGYIVGQLSPYRKGQFRLNQDQLDEYYKVSEVDFECECSGKFVRYASSADVSEEKHLRKISREEIDCCRQFAEELELPMKIVDVEHIFGGERIVFYFMADGRIDFRDLVKKLAHEYQTRIELRQIGSRDEAKLLGDYETCGQQCCCQRFLKTLKPINMRMAKMQKATLDPSKISGYCGRLKCCLRYEDVTYQELKKKLPKKNNRVKSEHGEGKVIDVQILTQLVMVESDSGERFAVPVEEIEVIESVRAEPVADNGDEEVTIDENENGSEEK
jgi:cell fate regulator YaaT (PSP1 superfamily)